VIDIALFESIFRVLDELAPLYAQKGIVRGPEGISTRNACPHGHFPCSDGKWVAVACTSDRMWHRMARNVLNMPELADSHSTTAERLADRDFIDGTMETFTKSLTQTEVVDACTAGDVPCGPINSIADIFEDPHFAAREVMTRFAHETLGEIVIPSVLPRLSETPGEITTLGPELGNWNDYVLNTLLNDESEIR